MSEDPSKPKGRPFFSPFAKELLELILEAEAKPSRGRGEGRKRRRGGTLEPREGFHIPI